MIAGQPLAIRRSQKARTDLTEIWLYIGERNQDAADRVLDEIERICKLIGTRPAMGRERPEFGAGIRSFGVMSWIVFYRIGEDHVEIVRVLHAARDFDALDF